MALRSDPPPANPDRDDDRARLTPEVLDDDEDLDAVIGAWGAADPEVRAWQAEIDLLSGALEEISCDEQWDVSEKLRAAIEAQYRGLLGLVARRAFEDGRCAAGVRAADDERDLPHLDEHVLADGTRLGVAIDKMLQAEGGLRALRRRIGRADEQIRTRVDAETWNLVLAADALGGEAASVAQELLVRWAYRAGARRAGGR